MAWRELLRTGLGQELQGRKIWREHPARPEAEEMEPCLDQGVTYSETRTGGGEGAGVGYGSPLGEDPSRELEGLQLPFAAEPLHWPD